MLGLPPLTREPLEEGIEQHEASRITPAYAGTTRKENDRLNGWQDHPRLRGNHCILRWPSTGFLGSPPLTREPLSTLPSTFSTLRITPAYAGTTRPRKLPLLAFEDHPRLRGNHDFDHVIVPTILGSPPLTREPLRLCHRIIRIGGITPAYAGTTAGSRRRYLGAEDHPRLRGNHRRRRACRSLSLGSPPLTREPQCCVPCGEQACRITPAYAGTTTIWPFSQLSCRDHPRLRGNHAAKFWKTCPIAGSPPLTREPLAYHTKTVPSCGITPAYAGTTSMKRLLISLHWDHPRLRGNHWM